MPNIKSAKKRVALSKAAYEKNKADKSALKTAVKKFEAAVASGNREQADSAYFRGLVDELAERIPNLRSQMLRSLGNIQPGYLLDPAYLKPGDPD